MNCDVIRLCQCTHQLRYSLSSLMCLPVPVLLLSLPLCSTESELHGHYSVKSWIPMRQLIIARGSGAYKEGIMDRTVVVLFGKRIDLTLLATFHQLFVLAYMKCNILQCQQNLSRIDRFYMT